MHITVFTEVYHANAIVYPEARDLIYHPVEEYVLLRQPLRAHIE